MGRSTTRSTPPPTPPTRARSSQFQGPAAATTSRPTRTAPTARRSSAAPTISGGTTGVQGTQYLSTGHLHLLLHGPSDHDAGNTGRHRNGTPQPRPTGSLSVSQQEARQGLQEGHPGRGHREHDGGRRLTDCEARQDDHRQGRRSFVRGRTDLPDREARARRAGTSSTERRRPRSASRRTSPSARRPPARRSSRSAVYSLSHALGDLSHLASESYLERGQKNPRRPSFGLRGTTWT